MSRFVGEKIVGVLCRSKLIIKAQASESASRDATILKLNIVWVVVSFFLIFIPKIGEMIPQFDLCIFFIHGLEFNHQLVRDVVLIGFFLIWSTFGIPKPQLVGHQLVGMVIPNQLKSPSSGCFFFGGPPLLQDFLGQLKGWDEFIPRYG